MQPSKPESPDFLTLYRTYEGLSPGQKAELRRVVTPEDLIEVPSFSRLTRGYGHHGNVRRLVFCLPCLRHQDGGTALGEALARAGINEKRLFMIIRSQEPNDLVQLRRLLQQTRPTVDFVKAAWLLLRWHQSEQKQKLLEDFFQHQKESA